MGCTRGRKSKGGGGQTVPGVGAGGIEVSMEDAVEAGGKCVPILHAVEAELVVGYCGSFKCGSRLIEMKGEWHCHEPYFY